MYVLGIFDSWQMRRASLDLSCNIIRPLRDSVATLSASRVPTAARNGQTPNAIW